MSRRRRHRVQRLECHPLGYGMPSNASSVRYCRVVERHCSLFDLHFEGIRGGGCQWGEGRDAAEVRLPLHETVLFTYYLIKGAVRRNSSVDIVTKLSAGHAS